MHSHHARHFQSGFIDLLKIIAAQLIVLHHLAFYGPMSDYVRPFAPMFIGWLDTYARIAVQVFLVTSGFLAAKSLSPHGLPGVVNPLGTVWRRYIRLVPPFMVATGLAVGASLWAGSWMTHFSISAVPTLPQLAAHALLLHTVLDYESVSAGAWYVAIDFQLYALLTLLLWLTGKWVSGHAFRWLVPVIIIGCVCLSLLYFNRDTRWDAWAVYFFGSYGLGVIAWWASDPKRPRSMVTLLMAAMLVPVCGALLLDFRSRIAVALIIACALVWVSRSGSRRSGWASRDKGWSRFHGLGNISYGIFLVHFPVCLMVNAVFMRFVAPQPLLQAFGMILAWMTSIAAGALFYRWVQLPLSSFTTWATRRPFGDVRTPQFKHPSRFSTLK
ncbi:acyltransferase family protein [Glaciimonas immobilis]|uniref:Peptidoglycan/LPS O-acetylase OafA/YrhL n=1 Tax=Glaciimonas immobilis TaxID=728004 RepID=A0A840RZB1_9BURK|nr:acyltransferase [Glaciimonas immobilis]KAF3998356.1 acyltransferase [Glaciimonas immobilis]MBB5201984.1 peptidoglycan/LPS O-acetylase OafA/YrhL [Glaciimonas immobilis]